MAGLFGALTYSSQALSAQSAGLQTAGKNLANVNTPGYARQRVTLQETGTVGTGVNVQSGGVQATGVQSLRDKYLDAQVASENSVTSQLQAKYDSMSRAESGLGESISSSSDSGAISDTSSSGSSGVNGALSDFFNAFQALSTDPTSSTQKQVLMQNAGTLADKINTADSNLASEQASDTQRVSGNVDDANGLLSDIASLNTQIAKAEAGSPGSALDLRDQRQAKIESLSQDMNVKVTTSSDYPNQVQISATDSQGNAVSLVDRGNVVAPLSFDGTNISAGSGSTASTLSVTGGAIAGTLQARDTVIGGLRDSLKAMAGQLTSAVNTAYNANGTGANFFAANPTGGQLLQVDAATTTATIHAGSTGDAGANDVALAVAAVANKSFSTTGGDAVNGTLSGYYSGVVSNFGAQLSNTSSQITDQGLVSTQISSQRDSVSGVSIDEETTNLMQYQRAFQASSRVVSVIDSMFDDVMSMVPAS